uniref:Uncharacterized protein n=1 Tax=Zooxanthella nutricula TaxID=1333877 RepID=A0A7S2PGM2_9DINO
MLVGIESSAPLKEDVFGAQHATDGKSKEISAFGKRKWRDYRKGGQEVPAELGGARVTFNAGTFQRLVQVCDAANLSKPSDGTSLSQESEQRLFKSLLVAPDKDISDILEDQLGVTRVQGIASASAYSIVRSIPLCDLSSSQFSSQ